MHAPSPDVLDCCEEAFLFDLAREDIWLYRTTTTHNSDATAATCPPFSSREAVQHHRTAAVEWSTLRVLLRHAVGCCAAFNNSHEVDNFVLTSLLEANELSPSDLVAARERFVGKRVTTRDLVCIVTHAGPLQPSALENLKRVFHVLLSIERAMADVVERERDDRHAVSAAERAAWRAVVTASYRTQQLWKYERILRQQQAAQQLVLDTNRNAMLGSRTVPVTCASPKGETKAVNQTEKTNKSSSCCTTSAGSEVQLAYLDSVIGGQIRRSQAEVFLIQHALQAATTTLQSPTWCKVPMQHAVVEFTNRLDKRIATVSEKVTVARASVSKLCRMRAGRRLLAKLANKNLRPSVLTSENATGGDASFSCVTVSEALEWLMQYTKSAVDSSRVRCKEPPVEKVLFCLFVSVAELGSEVNSNGANGVAQSKIIEDHAFTCGKTADHANPVISFPVFDYFAEFCDIYPASADIDTRWSLFISYAARVKAGSDTAVIWFNSYEMHLNGFKQFLNDVACCVDSSSNDLPAEGELKFVLSEVLLPKWLTAPLYSGAA